MLIQALMYMAFCFTWVSSFMTVLTVSRAGNDIYRHICITTIVWSAYAFALTELLSAFHLIAKWYIFAGWAAFVLIQFLYWWKNKPAFTKGVQGFCRETARMIHDARKGPAAHGIGLVVIALTLLAYTYLALATVPYNWDSMTYHLARIVFWIEHKSVAYFDTNIMRQVFSPVFAEYINLHVFLLTGSDVFANMVQNFSLYGVCILIYGIMRRMEIPKGGRILGIIILLSTEVVIAESISTQVDLVGALYLVILVYLLLQVLERDRLSTNREGILEFAALGLDCGLIYITKSNVCIPAAMIILFVIAVKLIRKESVLRMTVLGGVSALSAALVAGMSFLRNYLCVGDIFAKDYLDTIVVGTAWKKYILLNILKNYTSCAVNSGNASMLEGFIYSVAEFLRADVNKPEISFGSVMYGPKYHVFYWYHMDYASASLMMLLLLPALAIILWLILTRKSVRSWLSAVFVLQFIALLGLIRWQPWINRLLLPSMTLLIVSIVYAFAQFYEGVDRRFGAIGRKSLLAFQMILVLLCLNTSVSAFIYHNKIAWENVSGRQSRVELYHAGRENKAQYMNICALIDENDYKSIGLFTSMDSYQYPVLARYVPAGIKVENVYLKDALMTYGSTYDGTVYHISPKMNTDFHPDAIFVADLPIATQNDNECYGGTYRCVYVDSSDPNYSLWERVSDHL